MSRIQQILFHPWRGLLSDFNTLFSIYRCELISFPDYSRYSSPGFNPLRDLLTTMSIRCSRVLGLTALSTQAMYWVWRVFDKVRKFSHETLCLTRAARRSSGIIGCFLDEYAEAHLPFFFASSILSRPALVIRPLVIILLAVFLLISDQTQFFLRGVYLNANRSSSMFLNLLSIQP